MGRRPGKPEITSLSSLRGKALLRMAKAAGLSQARLAAYLGLGRRQITFWASNQEVISPNQLPGVTKRIREAVEHSLVDPNGPGKAALAHILDGVFVENLQAAGFPAYTSLRAMLERLAAISTAAGGSKDVTPFERELLQLSGALNLTMRITKDLAELLELLDCPALSFLSGSVEATHGTDISE